MKLLIVKLYRWLKLSAKRFWNIFSQQPLPQTSLLKDLTNHQERPNWKQFKLLPSIYSKNELYLLLGLIIILMVASGILGWRWYLNNTHLVPKTGGEYSEGLVGTPTNLNPILAPASEVDQNITRILFSGLFQNINKELVPDLVESYSLTTDGKNYKLTLKPNLFWSDGEKLTTQDILFTINAIQNPEISSPLLSGFTNVKVEVLDERTIIFELPDPYSSFLYNLTFGILPKHIWQKIEPKNWRLADYNLKPVSNGPYRYLDLNKNKLGNIHSYSLEINPHYHLAKPFIKKVTFKFYPDYESALQALQDGNINGLSAIPRTDLDKINTRLFKLYRLDIPQYTAVFYNSDKNHIFKDKTVRQALALAVDKQAIIDQLLKDWAIVIHSPATPETLGYTDKIKKYNFNPQQAGELLEQAGWKLGEDGWRKKDNTKLALTLSLANREEYMQVAEMIKTYWQNIGIEVTLNIVPKTDFTTSIINTRDYQAVLTAELLGYDSDAYPFWHSSQNQPPGLSLSLFADQDINKILEQSRQSLDQTERANKLSDFQTIVAEQAYALFLYNPSFALALDRKIKGFNLQFISLPADHLANINYWYEQTVRVWK